MVSSKVAIVGTVGVPAKYGGFETLAEYLTRYLSGQYDLTVYCSSKSYDVRPDTYNGARLVYLPLNANGVQSILYDMVSIFRALGYADTILVLGVSGCVVLPLVKLLSSKKVIVNIDGLEWKRDKWSGFAKWFLKLSERVAVRYADRVVTDNKVIQDYVLAEYGAQSSLIAYGGDHVGEVSRGGPQRADYPFTNQKYAFSVCRIEPENNILLLLAAAIENNVLPLVIVGNWDASHYGRELRSQYEGRENIYLLDPIYDQQALSRLRDGCFLYLHGHSAGGTNPSLVEAMYSGLPIYAFDVDYNRETTEQGARYFSSAAELAGMLDHLDEASLESIGERMAEIAQRRYRWELVANQYAELLS